MLIKDIVTVQTGLFKRPVRSGDMIYLQAKYFNENGDIIDDILPEISSDHISTKHILKDGDVLFSAKGTKNFALVYDEDKIPNAAASTSFFVIRILDKKVLPKYLAWFLNSPAIQTFLKGHARGTSMPSISKQVIESLEFTIPSLDKQTAILEITKFRDLERALKQEIEIYRDKQIQQQILEAIKKKRTMINIPCPSCGCQNCEAETKSGEKVKIKICRCNDGSGEFNVTIIPKDKNQIKNEKHQCDIKAIEDCLTSRYNIDLNSLNHKCHN